MAMDGKVPYAERAALFATLKAEMAACRNEWEVVSRQLRDHKNEHEC